MAYGMLEAWRSWTHDTAARLGLALEDPVAYHQGFPAIPVPGIAHVVRRGQIPGSGEGRLVVHRERDAFRPAVIVADRAGAEPTPPGGIVHSEEGLRVETARDLRAAWSISSYSGHDGWRHRRVLCGRQPRTGSLTGPGITALRQ